MLPAVATQPTKRIATQIAGYAIALAGLVWVFHDVDFQAFFGSMTNLRWEWMALAVIFDVLSYFCQGVRWQLLLRPLGQVSVLQTTQAIYVGLFTNEIIPLRVGELVRMFLVSRWLPARFAMMIPSLIVERMFDGIWLALAIALAALFVPLPRDLVAGEELLGTLIISLVALFVYLVFRKKQAIAHHATGSSSGWQPLRFISAFVERVANGLQQIGTSRYFYLSLLTSVFILIFQILSLWSAMIGFRISLSIWEGAVVLLILHLGTAIPNAPSNVGSYQFFTVVGLALFGIDKAIATGFSVVAFLILTIPLWLIGLLSLWRTGMNLSAIRSQISRLRES